MPAVYDPDTDRHYYIYTIGQIHTPPPPDQCWSHTYPMVYSPAVWFSQPPAWALPPQPTQAPSVTCRKNQIWPGDPCHRPSLPPCNMDPSDPPDVYRLEEVLPDTHRESCHHSESTPGVLCVRTVLLSQDYTSSQDSSLARQTAGHVTRSPVTYHTITYIHTLFTYTLLCLTFWAPRYLLSLLFTLRCEFLL